MLNQPLSQATGLMSKITTIYTLGPSGTNCERAARIWFERRGQDGAVCLFPTLEVAIEALQHNPHAALLGCVVYPDLHTIVFSNLDRLKLVDVFIVPTHNMVLATRQTIETIRTVATHPAPQHLVPTTGATKRLVNSNVQAALDCAAGITDACITTCIAADQTGLKIAQDFGPVPMGFTIHAQVEP